MTASPTLAICQTYLLISSYIATIYDIDVASYNLLQKLMSIITFLHADALATMLITCEENNIDDVNNSYYS